MRILVDTQCWLWMSSAPERFSDSTRATIEDTDNELYLSAASAWEIVFNHALGKLRLPEPPERYVTARLAALKTLPLAVEYGHALHVATLPLHHRDPIDRLLIAQAQIEHLLILTADPWFDRYDVTTIRPVP